jgi:A/G-specific adenine glycosylase
VLTRLFDIHLDLRRPDGERELRRLGMSVLPSGRASEFNQALMDLGAMVCTPRSPACHICPLTADCLALSRGTQEELPIRQPKHPLPMRAAVAAVLYDGNSVLLKRRPEEGLLGGLWGFPGGFIEVGESNQVALSRVIKEQLGLQVEIERSLPSLAHAYTHFRATLQPFTCRALSSGRDLRERGDIRWVKTKELDSVPMGKLDRMLANKLELAWKE